MELEQNTLASTGMFGGQPHRWLGGKLGPDFVPQIYSENLKHYIYTLYILHIRYNIYIYIWDNIYYLIYICHTRFLILNIQTQLAWRRRATQRARYHIPPYFMCLGVLRCSKSGGHALAFAVWPVQASAWVNDILCKWLRIVPLHLLQLLHILCKI